MNRERVDLTRTLALHGPVQLLSNRPARRKTVKDTTIERRFRRDKDFAGLAFWLYITREWVPEPRT